MVSCPQRWAGAESEKIFAYAWAVGSVYTRMGADSHAVLGTLVGYQARGRLAGKVGRDLPIALLEDVVAIGGGFAIAAVTAAL